MPGWAFPFVTAATAGALGIWHVLLTMHVGLGRVKYRTALGDGGHEDEEQAREEKQPEADDRHQPEPEQGGLERAEPDEFDLARAGGNPDSSNSPSLLQSLVNLRSPSKIRIVAAG